MGGLISKAEDEVPRGLVLVPPLFERDFRGRSRMTKSSYDWMFCKPGLKWLMNDYIKPEAGYGLFRFRPSEDPRLSVHARIGARLQNKQSAGAHGRMALRFQPTVEEPLTFVDIKSGTSGAGAVARACLFDVAHGMGVFAVLPLTASSPGASPEGSLGLRYSSPTASVGCITQPLNQSISKAWAVGKSGPFTFGWQLTPQADLLNGGEPSLSSYADKIHRQSSYAVAYSPEATTGRSNFATAVEIREQRQLTVSLLYHMAVQRLCRNPLEEDNVVGITNYMDLGLQVATNLVEGTDPAAKSTPSESHLRLGASWQINKNWLVKARVGSDSAAAAAVLKAWWQPSMTFSLSAVYSFITRTPRLGFFFSLENYGNIRYERSAAPQRMGRALVQRHVALPEDLANKEGKGLLVQAKDLENKALLGQVQANSAKYL